MAAVCCLALKNVRSTKSVKYMQVTPGDLLSHQHNDSLSQSLCSTLTEDLQMNLASELAKLFLPELQWCNFARRKLKQVGIFEVLINFNFYAIYKTKKLFNVNNVILLIVLNGIWQYSIPRMMFMWRIFNWKSYSDMSAKNVGRKENNFGVCSEEFRFNGLGHFLHFLLPFCPCKLF